MTEREDRIREIAYFLWLEEGCPDGGAERHWLAAEASLEPKRAGGESKGAAVEDSPALLQPSARVGESDLADLTRSIPAEQKRTEQRRGLSPAK